MPQRHAAASCCSIIATGTGDDADARQDILGAARTGDDADARQAGGQQEFLGGRRPCSSYYSNSTPIHQGVLEYYYYVGPNTGSHVTTV